MPYTTIIVSCHEEQDQRMVYRSKKKGVIKVDSLDKGSYEITTFTVERLYSVIRQFNADDYQVMSITNAGGRGNDAVGLTLSSTVVLSKKTSY
jgi:hypothetical protein